MMSRGISIVEYKVVKIGDIVPNNWNPNVQRDEIYMKVKNSIEKFGFTMPVVVRENEQGKYEIIDGEHRWKAASELKIDKVPIVVIEGINVSDAKQLTVILNELRGELSGVKFAKLLNELVVDDKVDLNLVAEVMPWDGEVLEGIRKSLDYKWDNEIEKIDNLTKEIINEVLNKQMKMVVGKYKFSINKVLGERFIRVLSLLLDETEDMSDALEKLLDIYDEYTKNKKESKKERMKKNERKSK